MLKVRFWEFIYGKMQMSVQQDCVEWRSGLTNRYGISYFKCSTHYKNKQYNRYLLE